jgi:thiol:disulfide interchange protein
MFPHAIKWLPKPGNWMVRMKEFAGFVLMGTVIFFIYFLEQAYVVPLLVMLLGIGLALWMIGNLYDVTSHIRHKMTVRIVSLSLAALICTFGYSLAGPADNTNRLPWQDFSEARLNASLAENKTVLVDFTADWCASCKFLEATVLKTDDVTQALDDAGVVTMQADYTKKPAWMSETIKALGGIGVPVIAIFPADRPYLPIVFAAGYTKGALLEAIEKATGGRRSEQTASRAPRANER